MTTNAIFSDLAILALPFPERPDENDPEAVPADVWKDQCAEIVDARAEFAENLRLTWENVDGFDPLLSEIRRAREQMLLAERRFRRLIAYGREFVSPRPYRLEDLARAGGMSLSGTRTAYDDDEVSEISELIGTTPRKSANAS